MKAEKDIEKQLLDAEAAWDATPPGALWDSLEARLEADLPPTARKPKNWPFRILALIPPIAIAVALLWPSDSSPAVARQFAQHSVDLSSHRHVSLHQAFDDVFGQAAPSTAPIAPTQPVASTNATAAPNPAPGLAKYPTTSGDNAGAQSVYNTAVVQSFVIPGPQTNKANMYAGNPDLEVQNYTLPNGNMLVTNGNGNPIDTVSSISQYAQLYPNAFDNNRYLQLNSYRNDLNFNLAEPVDRSAQADLQHLKWLLGSWRKQGTAAGSMEDWRLLDEFTLVGRGYFVVNGDTVVTQEMRIEQRGPNVYYIVAQGPSGKPLRFRLRSRNSNEAVFLGDSPKNPQELVIRNNPSTQEVETILQDPEQGNEARSARAPHSPQSPLPAKQVMKRTR